MKKLFLRYLWSQKAETVLTFLSGLIVFCVLEWSHVSDNSYILENIEKINILLVVITANAGLDEINKRKIL